MDCQNNSTTRRLSRFFADERGATMIEYGLMAALISVALIGVITATGGGLKTTYTTIKSALAAM